MFVFLTRIPKPAAAYWPGRRWLAALDAIGWPALCFVGIWIASAETQSAVLAFAAVLVCVGMARLWRAVFHNETYWFITWRLLKILGGLAIIGLILKVTMGSV